MKKTFLDHSGTDSKLKQLIAEKREQQRTHNNEQNKKEQKLLENFERMLKGISSKEENKNETTIAVPQVVMKENVVQPQPELNDLIKRSVQRISADQQDARTPVQSSDPIRTEIEVIKKTIADLHRFAANRSQLGGGGEVRLEFLDDVNRSSAKVNNKFLKYDAASGKWVGADGGAGGDTGQWTFTAEGGYNARTDADIVIQAVGSGNIAGVYWNLDPDDAGASSSTLAVQSTGLNFQHFDGTDVYALSFDVGGTLTTAGDIVLDGSVVGAARIQPENNPMAEIILPLDVDANTTPLTLYSEGAAGIKIDGRLTGSVATVAAAATAPTLDLLTPVVVLNYTAADQSYILPDGTFDGQIVYFLGIPASGTTYYHYTVNLLGTFRTVDGDSEIIVTSNGLWYPWGETYSDGTGTQNFTSVNSVHASHAVFAIWAGNAWNVSRGTISYS